MKPKMRLLATALAVGLAVTGGHAIAQMAVFDPANFTQNLQQVGHMVSQMEQLRQQLQTARDQLAQQKAQYEAITGSRGMSLLQTDINRGYIPRNWQETLSGGNSQIANLASDIKRAAGYLSDADLAGINSVYRAALRRSGDQAANNMASNAAVFQESGDRFQRLEILMGSIDSATDDKAIQDLQARIQVEQVMLQNELIRAQSMNAMIEEQRHVERQRQRQQAMSESFDYP